MCVCVCIIYILYISTEESQSCNPILEFTSVCLYISIMSHSMRSLELYRSDAGIEVHSYKLRSGKGKAMSGLMVSSAKTVSQRVLLQQSGAGSSRPVRSQCLNLSRLVRLMAFWLRHPYFSGSLTSEVEGGHL